MRLNVFLAQNTSLSRRSADKAIAEGRVAINHVPASLGQTVADNDLVTLDNQVITPEVKSTTIMLNKPAGYVCSRAGQGSKTIYDLLPENLHHLNPVGRLDKDSTGLLLLTNDGQLANQLTHPRYQKTKVYQIEIDKPLSEKDFTSITKTGIDIGDTTRSQFQLVASSKQPVASEDRTKNASYFLPSAYYWRATLAEGRNRQIRRTFEALGYKVTRLHRTEFSNFKLSNLKPGNFQILT